MLISENLKFNSKKWFINTIFLFVIVCSCKVWSQDVSVLQGKPVFKLEIEAYGLVYFVSANGGSVFNEFDADSQISVDLPINQWMHPESSEFSTVIFPKQGETDFSESSYLHVTLLVQDFDNKDIEYRLPLLMFNGSQYKSNKEMEKSLTKGRYHLTENNEVKLGSGAIDVGSISKTKTKYADTARIYSREVIIPNSLPLWAFFNSDTLPDYDAMSPDEFKKSIKEIFPAYKKVQDLLIAGDVDALVTMFAERSREADLAFYQTPGTMSATVRRLTQQFLDDPEWSLDIRTSEQLGLLSYDNKKLVSLVKGGAGALGFAKENGRYYGLEIVFRQENGQWIVTR